MTRDGGGGQDIGIFLWVAKSQAGMGAPCWMGVGVGGGNDRIARYRRIHSHGRLRGVTDPSGSI